MSSCPPKHEMGMRESRDVRVAARRLRRAVREAAGVPLVTVSADYRDGIATLRGISVDGENVVPGQDQPPSDVVVLMSDGYGPHAVARATWDGKEMSGKVDADGAVDMAIDNENIEWDDIVDKLGRTRPDAKQMTLPFPKQRDKDKPGFYTKPKPDIPRENVADSMLVVPDARGADFVQAAKLWLHGVARAIAKLEDLGTEDWVQCEDCGTLLDEGDAIGAWGDHYCQDHAPSFCHSCDEPISEDEEYWDEDSGNTYCQDCAPDRREDMWDDFYATHPKLREMDALRKAADQDEMEPEVYITLYRDLRWTNAYGGSPWRHIAETWRDLAAAAAGQGDPARLNVLVDHTFDLVHNTGSLFTKAKGSVRKWLFQALEAKYFLDPLEYRGKLSADVRKLLDLHIRYRGGVRVWKEGLEDKVKVMEKFERNLLRERDMKMAQRLWNVHDLNANMFRDRDAFLEVAFWSQIRSQTAIDGAKRLRRFLKSPARATLIDLVTDMGPGMFKAGTSHPAGDLFRREFVPKALKLLDADAPLRAEFAKGDDDKPDPEVVGQLAGRPYLWDAWNEFFKGERRRRKDEAKEPALATALLAAFVRTALKQTDFYDFYALTLIDCGGFPDDIARMCRGLRKVISITVAKSLVEILKRAVIREARHVSDALG